MATPVSSKLLAAVQGKYDSLHLHTKQPVTINNFYSSLFSISKEDVIRALPKLAEIAKPIAIALVALLFFKVALALYISEPWLWWEPVHFVAHTFMILSALSTLASYLSVSPLWDRYVTPWAEATAKNLK